MYKIRVNGNTITVTGGKQIDVAESLNTEKCQFIFNSEWSGLTCYACFKNSNLIDESQILLDSSYTCTIPGDVLAKSGDLYVGALGVNAANGNIVKPTVWERLAIILEGISPTGQILDSNPSAIGQLTGIAEEALETANEALDIANNFQEELNEIKSTKTVINIVQTSVGFDVYYSDGSIVQFNFALSAQDENFRKLVNGELEVVSSTMLGYIEEIRDYAFYGLDKLSTFKFSDFITEIGQFAFQSCINLTSIKLPNSLENIKYSAFRGCTKLSEIIFGNGIKTIDSYAFSECNALISITIPNSVTSIGTYAFDRCTNLESVSLSNSMTSISNYTFSQCSELDSIEILNNITGIGSHAFELSGLTSITIPGSVESIGTYAFQNCTKLESVTISNGVTNIGNSAFTGCTKLSNITIPNTVSVINQSLLQGCTTLGSVILGNAISRINAQAFMSCSSLTKITINTETVPTLANVNAFSGLPDNYEICVPANSVNAYKNDTNWNSLSEHIVAITE